MPSLKFNSLDINYEVSGAGPLLILHHGFGSWGRDWIRGGWLDALNPHATILIFDSVGHGLSTRSHNPSDHTVEKRAALVIALADYMEVDKFGFLGFSMGGRTGFEIAEDINKGSFSQWKVLTLGIITILVIFGIYLTDWKKSGDDKLDSYYLHFTSTENYIDNHYKYKQKMKLLPFIVDSIYTPIFSIEDTMLYNITSDCFSYLNQQFLTVLNRF